MNFHVFLFYNYFLKLNVSKVINITIELVYYYPTKLKKLLYISTAQLNGKHKYFSAYINISEKQPFARNN